MFKNNSIHLEKGLYALAEIIANVRTVVKAYRRYSTMKAIAFTLSQT